jgi:rubredoxin
MKTFIAGPFPPETCWVRYSIVSLDDHERDGFDLFGRFQLAMNSCKATAQRHAGAPVPTYNQPNQNKVRQRAYLFRLRLLRAGKSCLLSGRREQWSTVKPGTVRSRSPQQLFCPVCFPSLEVSLPSPVTFVWLYFCLLLVCLGVAIPSFWRCPHCYQNRVQAFKLISRTFTLILFAELGVMKRSSLDPFP